MGKRRGASRSRERDYVLFGKPEALDIEHVEAEQAPDGSWVESRYVERIRGTQARGLDSEPQTPRWEQGGLHPSTCKGKPGISRTWERDGRLWCRGCYVIRYGEQPPADVTIKVRGPRKGRAPMTDLERLMRRPMGKL